MAANTMPSTVCTDEGDDEEEQGVLDAIQNTGSANSLA